mgnify:CR=1 FL=1
MQSMIRSHRICIKHFETMRARAFSCHIELGGNLPICLLAALKVDYRRPVSQFTWNTARA